MKVDRFTKIILTVIAVNLSILTVKQLNIITPAHADTSNGSMDLVDVKKYGVVPLNEDGSISVRLVDDNKLDVRLVDINTSDKLKVHIESSERYAMQKAGPMEVKLDQ